MLPLTIFGKVFNIQIKFKAMLTKREDEYVKNPSKFKAKYGDSYTYKIRNKIRHKVAAAFFDIAEIIISESKKEGRKKGEKQLINPDGYGTLESLVRFLYASNIRMAVESRRDIDLSRYLMIYRLLEGTEDGEKMRKMFGNNKS